MKKQLELKKYIRTTNIMEYTAIQFDGTKHCAELILEMCEHNECVQYIDGKGLLVAKMDGTSYAEKGEYLLCGGNCCMHPVKEEYFINNYQEIL